VPQRVLRRGESRQCHRCTWEQRLHLPVLSLPLNCGLVLPCAVRTRHLPVRTAHMPLTRSDTIA
jgi:hypothetical protein